MALTRPIVVRTRADVCILRWPGEEKCDRPAQAVVGIGLPQVMPYLGTDEPLTLDAPVCFACLDRLRDLGGRMWFNEAIRVVRET